MDKELLEKAEKSFYNLNVGEKSLRAEFLRGYSNFLGVFASFCTLHFAPAVLMVEGIQKRAYRNYTRRRLDLGV
jgi:hypothetical protein